MYIRRNRIHLLGKQFGKIKFWYDKVFPQKLVQSISTNICNLNCKVISPEFYNQWIILQAFPMTTLFGNLLRLALTSLKDTTRYFISALIALRRFKVSMFFK